MEKELEKRINDFEDNYTERKLDNDKRSDIRRTIVAFANSVPDDRTAVLFIGVRNNGDIEGVPDPDKKQKLIREICEIDCYPPIKFNTEVLEVSSKRLVCVIIPSSKDRPHFAGPAYIRKGSESVIASKGIFNDLVTGRFSKPGEILKWKEKLITVIAKGKKLGNTKNLHDPSYRARHECIVKDCTAHYVKLFDPSDSRYVSEPLDNITLDWDESKDRLRLIVQQAV